MTIAVGNVPRICAPLENKSLRGKRRMKCHLFATDEPAKDFGNENAHGYCADGSLVATGK